MATQDNPLLSLAPEKQQQLVDLVESNDIESLATKTGLTRRQILGIGATLAGSGALGGYAATEAINPAQAQADTGDSDGNVGLPTDRVDVFADGVDTNSLSTGDALISQHRNDRAVYRGNGDWASLQAAIDAVTESDNNEQSGLVELDPFPGDGGTGDTFYNFGNDTLPIVVKPGVTLDLTGVFINASTDASALFDLRGQSTVLGHNCIIRGSSLTGDVFLLDGDATSPPGSSEPVKVLGYPKVVNNSPSSIYKLEQTNGGNISTCELTATAQNPRLVHINSDGGGYINNNTLRFIGKSSPSTGEDVITIDGTSGDCQLNKIVLDGLQVGGGDNFVRMANGNQNRIIGNETDAGNGILIESGAGAHNRIDTPSADPSLLTNNSGEHQQVIQWPNESMAPMNLAGMTGNSVGYRAVDDGTNVSTSGPMECLWTGSAWQPADGGSTFT